MEYRRFGKTEMCLSQLSLGCMRFTGETPEEIAIETVKQAVARGVNHIETARCYGNSEERVGKALKEILRDVPREELYITTKIGPSANLDAFKRNWDTSMSLLGLDYLDNLDWHGPTSPERVAPAMREDGCLGFVRKLQDQGTLRHFGFSTHGYLKGVMDLLDTREFDSINLHYYYFNQGLQPVVKRAAELDMGVFIISPSTQGGNLHKPTPRVTEACAPLHPVTFNHMWLLNHPEIHTVAFGARCPEDLDRNLLAEDYVGTGEARQTFDQVAARVKQAYRERLGGTFCTACSECLPCPEDINIPGLLNWRNLAVGLDMEDHARERYSRVGENDAWVPGVKGNLCTRCGDCLPRCPEKLQIPELLWDAHRRLETGEVRSPMWQHDGDLVNGTSSHAPPSRFGVVVLAAGASRRMGQPKLLMNWDDQSIIARVVQTFRDAGAHQVAAVHAPDDSALRAELERLAVDPVENPDAPTADMFSSVCRGLDWTGWQSDITHLVIALGDMPAISSDTLSGLFASAAAHPGQICQPRNDQRRGHPVVIPRELADAILTGNHPHLRAALEHHPVFDFDTGDNAIHADIDTADDFHSLKNSSLS